MDLEVFRRDFNEVRRDSDLWGQFECQSEESGLRRYAAGKELQYSLKDEDYDFIKFLLTEEIKARESDAFQGFGDSLVLLSYLLATFRKTENVLLFERGKNANFDTFCGYDARFIFSAGVEKTNKYLEDIALNERNGYLFRKGKRLITEIKDENIDQLFLQMENQYPANPDHESAQSKLETAIILNEHRKYKALFKEAELSGELDDYQLSFYAGEIGFYEKEIFYLRKRYESADENFDKVMLLTKISESYLNAGNPIVSYDVFLGIKPLLKLFDDWKTMGVGRSILHQWYKIALSLHKIGIDDLGKKAFLRANALIWIINNLSYNVLIDANSAAIYYGSDSDKIKYRAALREEKLRIENIAI